MRTLWISMWAAAIAGMAFVAPATARGQTNDTVRKAFGTVDVTVTGSTRGMTVTIRHPNTAPQVVSVDSFGTPYDMTAFEQSRLIIRSTFEPLAEIAIIDLPSASLIDHFYAGPAAVSPTGRFVAFLAPTPRWREDSAVYLVYDVTTARSDNQMINIGPPSRIGVPESDESQWTAGRAFYPAINRERQTHERSYKTTAGDASGTFGPWHELQSPVRWLTKTAVAFVDYSNGVSQLVAADFSGGAAHPRVISRTLDARRLFTLNDSCLEGTNPEFKSSIKAHPSSYLRVRDLSVVATSTGADVHLQFVSSTCLTSTTAVVRLPLRIP